MKIFISLLFALISTFSYAERVTPIDVVKIINFECPHCASSNHLDSSFRRYIAQFGGRLVIAPVSPQIETNARDRVFYAVKKVDENASFLVKDQIFRAYHEFNLKFDDTYQVEEWIKQELQNTDVVNLDWENIAKLYFSKDVDMTMIKALKIIIQNDLENLPAYVYYKDGKVLKIVDYSEDGGIKGLKEDIYTSYDKLTATYNIQKKKSGE